MRVISFKIWSDFAHFRKHYTTSSPLTHSIPPPSALRGFVGAIMGFSRENFPEILSPEKSKFGVRVLLPIKKIRLGLNYMDTKDGSWVQLDSSSFRPIIRKDGHGNPRLHTQVRVEFLKDPMFEIFFHHEDYRLLDEFAERLRSHRTVYTPYLGITECIANFEFLWDAEVQPFQGVSNISSAFKLEALKALKLKSGTGIVKERLPLFIDADRLRKIGDEVIFNPHADSIVAEIEGAFRYPQTENTTFAFIG